MHIVKTNVTQQVFEYLKKNIESGTWPIGSKIPSENRLTELLAVSRSSIRLAIQQCIALEVLESQHGKGTFVKRNDISGIIGTVNTLNDADYDNICQVLQFREIIEKESAYLAANNAKMVNLKNLEECLEKMKKNINKSDEFVRQDMLFHKEICRASGNKILEMALSDVLERTAKNHKQLNDLFGYKDGVYFHTLLLEAIRCKDAKKAKHIMKAHIRQAIDNLKTD
ncbi:FadR/GntR family transcriptional regulator [Pectinatus haikarae]|uniref:GntR family transcriptional repressor for pyruvate dehydrogenase complex n=1 Tax=Pectinatus haikarae TaxID=349096 RepID=A0ABT9Y8B5_9FIRM|nr:FadR/GntR family transcriptional regulator [Pectinatus haikarae]MDQ0203979.1 GntR family transcriptional repressor for pyruvate dehydrogenase complex [Pectinatus haikarae]